MADRSKRNEKEKADRRELAEYRKVVADALGHGKTPEDLKKSLAWYAALCEFVNTLGSRRKPYFKPGELPK